MSYHDRIRQLERLYEEITNRIETFPNNSEIELNVLEEMKQQRYLYRDELSKLRRLQWEEFYERVDLDDDR